MAEREWVAEFTKANNRAPTEEELAAWRKSQEANNPAKKKDTVSITGSTGGGVKGRQATLGNSGEVNFVKDFEAREGRKPSESEMQDWRDLTNAGQIAKGILTGGIGLIPSLLSGQPLLQFNAKDQAALDKGVRDANAAAEPIIDPAGAARKVRDLAAPQFKSKLDPRFADLQYLAAEQARNRAAPTMQQGPQLEQRNNQIELLKQLEAGRGQDTAAKFQGQKALGEAAYRTAQQQGMGGGLAAAAEGTRQSQGVVSQVGEGALQQDMATRNMQNLLSTQGRGQDFQVTQAQNRVSIAQQESNNAMVKFYLTLGDDFATAQRRAQTSLDKLYHGALDKFQNQQQGVIDGAVQAVGTLFAL